MKKKESLILCTVCALILSSALILNSCQGINQFDESQEKVELSFTDVGKLHNELLANYYEKRVNVNGHLSDKLSELNNLNWKYLDEQGYSEDQIQEARLKLPERINLGYLKKSANEGFYVDTSMFLEELGDLEIYSQEFVDEISFILGEVQIASEMNVIVDYVNTDFMEKYFTDEDDILARDVFVDIFNNSYIYWTDFYSEKKSVTRLKRSSWVIINDGIGGILGSIFGPVGSVVTATAFSLATNEEI